MASISEKRKLVIGSEEISLGEASIMVGILNVTPDSFSDGGSFLDLKIAVARALRMFDQGARIVDIGGESTRPGFEEVPAAAEIARAAPVVEMILKERPDSLLSMDTSKVEVAAAALAAGCRVVNDIWGFQKHRSLAELVGSSGASAILMRNGRDGLTEGSIVARILRSWEKSLDIATRAGVDSGKIILDPGIGFGTTRQEDLEILQGLKELGEFGFPIMLGASRKRITAEPKGVPLEQRTESTLATTAVGISAGVDFYRVHDVAENARFADLADLIFRGGRLDG